MGLLGVARSLMNTIFRPSGRQLACPSNAGEPSVRFTGLRPLGSIVQMSRSSPPARKLSNRILPFSPGNAPSAGEVPAVAKASRQRE